MAEFVAVRGLGYVGVRVANERPNARQLRKINQFNRLNVILIQLKH